MSTEHSKRLSETLKKALDSALRSSNFLRKQCPKITTITDAEVQDFQSRLKTSMEAICEADITVSLIDEAAQEVDSSGNNDPEVFEEILERKKQNRKPAKEHPMYLKFVEAAKADENVDQDMSVRDEGPVIKCPISKKVMKTPMKNKLCGHTYDRASVQGLLKVSRRGIRCPVPGCTSQRFKLEDLEEDEELKRHISQLKKKVQE